MKKRLSGLIVAVVLFLAPSILGGDRKPIVAVFDVEVKRVKLSKSLLDGLSDYLATKLAGTGKYQIVPRDQLKKRLIEQKKKSFKQLKHEGPKSLKHLMLHLFGLILL